MVDCTEMEFILTGVSNRQIKLFRLNETSFPVTCNAQFLESISEDTRPLFSQTLTPSAYIL